MHSRDPDRPEVNCTRGGALKASNRLNHSSGTRCGTVSSGLHSRTRSDSIRLGRSAGCGAPGARPLSAGRRPSRERSFGLKSKSMGYRASFRTALTRSYESSGRRCGVAWRGEDLPLWVSMPAVIWNIPVCDEGGCQLQTAAGRAVGLGVQAKGDWEGIPVRRGVPFGPFCRGRRFRCLRLLCPGAVMVVGRGAHLPHAARRVGAHMWS